MAERLRATPLVEALHYRPGEEVWMLDMVRIRKVRIDRVEIDLREGTLPIARHLVSAIEAYILEDGEFKPAGAGVDACNDRITWQWPETRQLHESRDGAVGEMMERIREIRASERAEGGSRGE